MHAFESSENFRRRSDIGVQLLLSYFRLLKMDNLKWAVVWVFMVCENQKLAGSILSPKVQDCVKSIQPIAIQHDRAFMTLNPHMLHTYTVSTYHACAYDHLILMQPPISFYFLYSWCQVKLYCSLEVFHSRYFYVLYSSTWRSRYTVANWLNHFQRTLSPFSQFIRLLKSGDRLTWWI